MSDQNSGPVEVLLAAGGTGGHVFPAKALAETLKERGHAVALVTDTRGTAFDDGSVPVFRVHAGSPSRRGFSAKLRSVFDLGIGFIESWRLLGRLRPSVVVGFGGYPSVPPVLAAQRRGIATVLHEQNALLGRANRLLAARASRIASSFEGLLGADAHTGKTRLTGNPVRAEIRALREMPYQAPRIDSPCTILVTGGSQGATVFSDVVPDAVARLSDGLRARLNIVQQARPEDKERVSKRYEDLGVKATVSSFFGDLPERLAAAHLVVCRSGASTVSEITVAGRPAILVPYPHAADDHQTANARALDSTGAAWLLPQPDFQPDALAQRLEALFAVPGDLESAAARARASGYPDAVARLADVVLETATLADSRSTYRSGSEPAVSSPSYRPSSDDDRLKRRSLA